MSALMVIAVLVLVLALVAWFDGGREEMRQISQPVDWPSEAPR